MSKKEILSRKQIPNAEAFESDQFAINVANQYLPSIMRLRLEEGEIRLYLYVNTLVKDKDGKDINDWKNIYTVYDGDHKRDVLLGFVVGIESLANYERLLTVQANTNKFEEEIATDVKEAD